MKKLAPLLSTFALLACLSPEEAARDQLKRWDIPFTENEFVSAAENRSLRNQRVLETFLKAGINPNVTNQDGETALIAAVREVHLPEVKILLEGGAT